MKKKVFFNGRFLTQPITGVQRTAHEMVRALDHLIGEGIIDGKEFEFILIVPKGKILFLQLNHIRQLQKGFFSGNLWEQVELPLYTFGHLLISMGSISALLKKKQMVIVHDAATFSNPAYFKFIFRTWYQTAIRVLSKTALQIITVSRYSKEQLVKYTRIKENRISVISNAADHITGFGDADEEFKKKIDALQPFMLGVSSLHPHKNFEILSKAVVMADIAEYRMVIAGGAYPKSFDTIVLDESVIVLGYVTNEQLKYLYSKAALFIFPSLFEGFGIPPLEAMIMGCPVLSSNTTSLPEVLGDACEYFDPHDVQDLIGKIEMLVHNKNRLQELREKGYERAAGYSWEKSAVAMLALIKKFA